MQPTGISLQILQTAHAVWYQKQANNSVNKWAVDLNRYFSKDIQMVNKHMKRSSISLIIREMQIKTSHQLELPSFKKKSTSNNCWSGFGEKGLLLLAWGDINWYSHYEEQYGCSFKKIKIELSYDTAISLQRKAWFKNIHTAKCSLQSYLQYPEHETNLNVLQQRNE